MKLWSMLLDDERPVVVAVDLADGQALHATPKTACQLHIDGVRKVLLEEAVNDRVATRYPAALYADENATKRPHARSDLTDPGRG